MPIRFQCACGRSLRATEEQIGRKVRCPVCYAVRTVPGTRPGGHEEVLEVLPVHPSGQNSPPRSAARLPNESPDRSSKTRKPSSAPTAPLYPPSPSTVPSDFIVVNASYRWRVLLVLTSLLLFAALYVLLVIGAGFLVYWSVVYPIGEETRGAVTLKIGLVGSSILLFLFLLKGLFKRSQEEKGMHREITEDEHAELFQFIRQLCAELGSPFPHRIYVSPEVNAAVFYHESLLSLFLPAPKNLLIGLGLVNVLNLSEFKAVLAHEFGHFAQSSMKLGSYVYSANRIISDMVFGRDWFDDLLSKLKGSDARIAVFAWLCIGIVWTLRKLLEVIFRALNFANSALSRQMEFNADLVAVSVTGSDALICALARLDFANQALLQAWEDLTAAASHELYTQDLFFHQNHAASFLRKLRKDARLGEPPPIPDNAEQTVQVFEPGNEGIPLMWASHPSNHDRERNAKRLYIRGVVDERSPWLLFQDADDLRERVTRSLYRRTLKLRKDVALADAETVQSFIDDEHAEMTYSERYLGLYDGRDLEPGDLDDLLQQVRPEQIEDGALAQAHAGLFGGTVRMKAETYVERRQEYQVLQGIEAGEPEVKDKDFEFRGRSYDAGDAKRLRKKVERELEADREWLSELDRRVFRLHYRMAARQGPPIAEELVERYRFQLGVQRILNELNGYFQRLAVVLQRLGGSSQLNQADFAQALALFREVHRALSKCLATADDMRLPALKNLNAGEPLGAFLLSRALVREPKGSAQSLDGKWIGRFLEQLSEVRDKAQRIHAKNVGGILTFQEKIVQQWQARQRPAAAELSVETRQANESGLK